jgi:hypothetical protein
MQVKYSKDYSPAILNMGEEGMPAGEKGKRGLAK